MLLIIFEHNQKINSKATFAFEECVGEYVRSATRVKELSDHRIIEACAFLRRKVAELKDYAALQLGASSTGPLDSANLGSNLQLTGDGKTSGEEVSLTNFTLPKGFRWVTPDRDPLHIKTKGENHEEGAEYRNFSFEPLFRCSFFNRIPPDTESKLNCFWSEIPFSPLRLNCFASYVTLLLIFSPPLNASAIDPSCYLLQPYPARSHGGRPDGPHTSPPQRAKSDLALQ